MNTETLQADWEHLYDRFRRQIELEERFPNSEPIREAIQATLDLMMKIEADMAALGGEININGLPVWSRR
jgi:Arc/MetJ-type ribon-helix-helix transcriptional regulator